MKKNVSLFICFSLLMGFIFYYHSNYQKKQNLDFALTTQVDHLHGYLGEIEHALHIFINDPKIDTLNIVIEDMVIARKLLESMPYLDQNHKEEWNEIGNILNRQIHETMFPVRDEYLKGKEFDTKQIEGLTEIQEFISIIKKILPEIFTMGKYPTFNFKYFDALQETEF